MGRSKKIDDLVCRFSSLREKCIKSGESIGNIRFEFLREVYRVPSMKKTSSFFNWSTILWYIILPAVAAFWGYSFLENLYEPCLLEPDVVLLNDVSRKPSKCSLLCEGVNEIPRVSDLSKEEFIAKYAYSGRPVVITDAAKNWSAVGKFSFQFFKRLYSKNKEAAEENPDMGCTFFPYKSGFNSLKEALRMPKSRAEWKGQPWYIGWSNCDPVVRNELRRYYNRPYFIPLDAETGDLDWIFMGGPGPGAPIHIDMVNRPSWQAQLSGQKIWTLIPPPECEHVCKSMEVTMNKGEISKLGGVGRESRMKDTADYLACLDLIVVDTNQWFHSTKVVPTGELSITIGAEYD